jgi:hypothetical protein
VSRSTTNKVGIGVAVVLAVIGLIAVGFIIFMFIALQSFGSNK